jgi:hypothetical protein
MQSQKIMGQNLKNEAWLPVRKSTLVFGALVCAVSLLMAVYLVSHLMARP